MPGQNGSELASIDIYLVQQMDFRLPDGAKKKPTWKTNAFNMSFTASLTETRLGPKFRKYPDWLSYFMKMECIYHNSACIKLVGEESDLDFAREFAGALEPLEAEAGRRNERRGERQDERRTATKGLTISAIKNKRPVDVDAEGEHIVLGEEDDDLEEPPVFANAAARGAIDISGLEAWLFYEISLRQWQIIYKFTLTTTADHLNDLVVASPALRRTRHDLYNLVRDQFAVSDGTDNVLPCIQKVQRAAKAKALELCRTLYGMKKNVKADEVFTLPESCTNVSFFIATTQAKPLKNNLVRETSRAERKRDNVLDVFGKKGTDRKGYRRIEMFQFGGRFNTILIDCEAIGALGGPSDVSRSYQMQFMPTLFHSMLMWSYLGHMTEAMQLIERGILADSSAKNAARIRYFNSLINSIEYASFENETFKRGIEQDRALIYSKIEEKWNIERSLVQMKDFASYLSSFLDRDYQEHVLKSDRKQNVVLFLIALLGLFGLISVWDDYLDLVTSQYFHAALDSQFIDTVFPNIEALTMFSVWMPAIALVICIIAIICLIRWRPK